MSDNRAQPYAYAVMDTYEHMFDMSAMPAPRMTQRTKYKYAPYYVYKNMLTAGFMGKKFAAGGLYEVQLRYGLPMPGSWSGVKKQRYEGSPCGVKPDIDNLEKAVLDSLFEQDQNVVNVCHAKYYAEQPHIWVKVGVIRRVQGDPGRAKA